MDFQILFLLLSSSAVRFEASAKPGLVCLGPCQTLFQATRREGRSGWGPFFCLPIYNYCVLFGQVTVIGFRFKTTSDHMGKTLVFFNF